MDALLAEALQDFDEEDVVAEGSARVPAGREACEQEAAASGPTTEITPAAGLRGPSLPSRAVKQPQPSQQQLQPSSRAAAASPAQAAPRSGGDSSAAAAVASGSGGAGGAPARSSMPQLPTRKPTHLQQQPPATPGASVAQQIPHTAPMAPSSSSTSAGPKLPPEVQKLADDIMRLMEESGMDLQGGTAGPALDPAHLTSPALRDLAGRAAAVTPLPAGAAAAADGAASSSSGRGDTATTGGPPGEGGGFRSAALRGLAEQTKQTVDQQSKFARGEARAGTGAGAAAGTAAQQQRQQQGGAGGGPLGDLLGMLGGMAGGAGGGGAGAGGEGGMGFMVDYIMQNLLSKEVLYAPLKDIRDKYPPWLEVNRATLSADDVQRYSDQYASIQAVCNQYETDPANFSRLVELIQQMQTYGDPPAAIVDDMTGGMPEGLLGGGGGGGGGGPPGDPDDIGNFDVPEDFADLPQALKDKCPVQ